MIHSPLLEVMRSTRLFPVEAHTKKGETAIIWAAMQQQLDCVRILIAARANLNAQVQWDEVARVVVWM